MTFDISFLPEKVRTQIKVEDKGNLIDVSHPYVADLKLYQETREAVEKHGGKALGYYSGAMHYEIPKEKLKPAKEPLLIEQPKEKPIPIPLEEDSYNLKLSHQKLGPLVPRILDAYGNTVDGFHRASVDEKWPSVKAEWITDPIQLNCARLASNFARRTKWSQDDIERLNFIAETTGWTPKQIAENTGLAYRTIMRYLEEKHKEKPQEHELLTQTSQVATRQQPADLGEGLNHAVTCECCSLSTFYPQDYEGKQVCKRCFKELSEGNRQLPTQVQIPVPKVKAETIKIPKTAQDIQAQMHPQISKMEEAILLKLQEKGIAVESQKDFCIQSTRPDFYLPEHNLAVYLDGEAVHKHPEKDEALRELLTKRTGIQILSLTYPSNTKQAQDQILAEIVGAVDSAHSTREAKA